MKAFEVACKAMPKADVLASQALVDVIMKRRIAPQSRDLSGEDSERLLMIGAHVTAWDWLSPMLKNSKRDIAPCVNAMFIERAIVKSYRVRLLKDEFIGGLRRLLELALSESCREMQSIDPATKKLSDVKTWVWWDSFVVPELSQDVDTVLANVEQSFIETQQRQQRRMELERTDKEAITKLINYVCGMACAKASGGRSSKLSADVVTPLDALIDVSYHVPSRGSRSVECGNA
jgi:hypothetical protein